MKRSEMWREERERKREMGPAQTAVIKCKYCVHPTKLIFARRCRATWRSVVHSSLERIGRLGDDCALLDNEREVGRAQSLTNWID